MAKAAVVETNEQGTPVERALTGPAKLMQFLHDTRQEMTKVHSPTRAEVQATTIVVIITVFLFAAYFEAVDLVFGRAIDQMFIHLTRH
ncbi:MAG: preprotein translocase subunit SecE [Acidobacteria bacterium]|nr:preprotein translocase subunit SecE [Acidobacteriota bacterium]